MKPLAWEYVLGDGAIGAAAAHRRCVNLFLLVLVLVSWG